MNVEIINPLDHAGWDDLILTQPGATLFHSSHWARVLCSMYNYTPLYFTVRNQGRLSAVVPIMEIDSFLTGKRAVSLPFTDFCPPLVDKNNNIDELWTTIKDYGQKACWNYIEIRGGNGWNGGLSESSQCYEHVLQLSQDRQSVFEEFRDSYKRNIRKAQKAGVEVVISDSPESLKDFYRLNLMTRKRHGLPPQPFSFFKTLQQHILERKHGILLLARHHGKAIAGAICIHFGNTAMYKYAASDKQYQHLRPNNLIVWEALGWYCRQKNFTHFSFGRTELGHEGLRQFKSGWRGKESIVRYYQYCFDNSGSVCHIPQLKKWQTRILKKTPVGISKIIGSMFYKHIG